MPVARARGTDTARSATGAAAAATRMQRDLQRSTATRGWSRRRVPTPTAGSMTAAATTPRPSRCVASSRRGQDDMPFVLDHERAVPVYVYRRQDGSVFELAQRITDNGLVSCPTTG